MLPIILGDAMRMLEYSFVFCRSYHGIPKMYGPQMYAEGFQNDIHIYKYLHF